MKDNIKGILYLGLLIFIVVFVFNIINSYKIKLSNNKINNYLITNFDYVYILKNNKTNINFSLNNLFKIETKKISFNKSYKKENVISVSNNIDNNVINYKKDPIVYIYNTHNKENYYHSKTEPYNIIPTVVTTSYMLKETLKINGIESIVEERSTQDVLNKKKWIYAYSYKVTRSFLEDAKKKNPTLKYYIDIHRDSVKKNISTIKIKDKAYARVLFILGLENKNYSKNQKMISYINNEINKKFPNLSRGIYKKQGKGVNGVYNQDFSPNCILIEFGGTENTIEEVHNTVEVIGSIIAQYIGDNNG